MADPDENEIETIPDADADAEADVEGFGSINTTRSNIKSAGMAAGAAGTGGVSGRSEIAIKEQGVK